MAENLTFSAMAMRHLASATIIKIIILIYTVKLNENIFYLHANINRLASTTRAASASPAASAR